MPHCSALTNHCCLRISDTYTPCCRYENQQQRFPTDQYSYETFIATDFYKNIQQNMSQGWDSGCRPCQQEESIGKESLRQRYNQRLSGQPNKLEFLEISISNHCNLSCKMCNNMASSRWQAILDGNPELLQFDFNVNKTRVISTKQLFDNLDLSNLKEVKYLGGEPFITPDLYGLIENLSSIVDLSKIKFRCNTNCTFFPSKWIPLLNNFKQVIIIFSVDGIGDLCNYIRTGETWTTINTVIDQWLTMAQSNSKYELAVHTTLQAYNLHQFDQIKKFALDRNLDFFYKFIQEPNYLTLSCLPKDYINQLNLEDPVVKDAASNLEFSHDNFLKFVNYTKATDKILNTSIMSVIPNLAKLLHLAQHGDK